MNSGSREQSLARRKVFTGKQAYVLIEGGRLGAWGEQIYPDYKLAWFSDAQSLDATVNKLMGSFKTE